jgi:predicted DCC family thiol-disulfide oxidoreductase YuxK
MTSHSSKQSQDKPQGCLLIYDGRCRMCVTAKKGLERLSAGVETGDVRLIPYHSEEARQALGHRYQPGRPDAAFLVSSDGTIAAGLDAFLPLLSGLKGGRILAKLVTLPFLKPLGYLAYWLIARHRYRLFGEVASMTKPD